MLERIFRLEEHNTTFRTELIAGLTTFMTMAYIIFVNPSIVQKTGMPAEGVLIATAVSAALATLLMALLANYPFALAPGMGLNAYFTYGVVLGMGWTWQEALGAVFLSGILFLILTFFKVRETIINAIPMSLKSGISAGIGLFIAFIGLVNAGIVVDNPATLVTLGDPTDPNFLLAVFGLIITVWMMAKKVPGAILWGIIISTIIAVFTGITDSPKGIISLPNFGPWMEILGKLDISGALSKGIFTVVFSFLFVDFFDTAGTLVGVSQQAGFLDKKGNLPKAGRALLADSIGTIGGAFFGTPTVTTYIESASGVAVGGRTGLVGLVVAVCFLLSLFFIPIIGIVPAAATAPALIIVGSMMMRNVLSIDWNELTDLIPAFMSMITMPLTYSIATGIAVGFVVYPIVKLLAGKGREVHWIVYILGILFIFRFAFLAG
ncbi:guanine permease [Anoxybacter fermentans]|uniref:Guanine permease n=1 Tax=Anoxybacter fermentans TaxID=1323375 RepID=A0A3Q9HNG3_9FIRM|nr:NCS2 family permease [Anoxybacter fermentans]AZR72000.1 guanine permease [Anoxybacter fermentans]